MRLRVSLAFVLLVATGCPSNKTKLACTVLVDCAIHFQPNRDSQISWCVKRLANGGGGLRDRGKPWPRACVRCLSKAECPPDFEGDIDTLAEELCDQCARNPPTTLAGDSCGTGCDYCWVDKLSFVAYLGADDGCDCGIGEDDPDCPPEVDQAPLFDGPCRFPQTACDSP